MNRREALKLVAAGAVAERGWHGPVELCRRAG